MDKVQLRVRAVAKLLDKILKAHLGGLSLAL
jgi:hypothetical protein